MNKALVIYHRVDYDGLFSGMTARYFLENNTDYSVEMLGYNYGDPVPDLTPYSHIFMVDISLPPEEMNKIYDKAVWIDHHQTAIESSVEFGYSGMKGNRVNGIAACELTWNYFYPTLATPKIIEYLGAYDVWNKTRFPWDTEVVPLQSALRAIYGISMDCLYPTYTTMGFDLDYLFDLGMNIKKYEDYNFKGAVKNYAFPVLVAGKYKGVAMMTHSFGSRIFTSVLDDYDLYITFNRKYNNGKPTFNLSMYSEPGRLPDFHIGQYLKSFGLGGGGHQGAGGTVISEEQFYKLLEKGEI
jgi:hypothetical protein